jgi:putative endonuclease
MLSRGKRAENYAARWLRKQRIKILEHNFQSRWGEIDIIAMDDKVVCFIEVRYRKSSCYGTAAESVTTSKQHRISKTAQVYLQQHHSCNNSEARFDVISMSGNLDNPSIDWYKGAFMISNNF